MTDRRLALLRAARGFLELTPRAAELRLLHRWLDSWVGIGLITVGVERLGYRLSLSHIAEREWRAQFSAHPMWASVGFGVAATPWRAVQCRSLGEPLLGARLLSRGDDRRVYSGNSEQSFEHMTVQVHGRRVMDELREEAISTSRQLRDITKHLEG
jgi:hypothetical protein